MEFEKYIRKELLILIPVMYIIGMGLKKSKVADKHIPLILGTISVIRLLYGYLQQQILESGKEILAAFFTAVTQGVLAAGASVYASQLYIQKNKKQ